ncbi:MAG: Omp28-related outer membrane protein [Bacteroidetes bacterium]|nr:Omp28-related outer membrane protein [Bacteroidota bacterium]
MKKNLLTIVALTSFAGSVMAQLPVSTTPQNKSAVLEEFTGIYCGYCPDGHQIANTIKNSNPTKVVLINIHAGGYANVAVGEPDLKTTEGTAINSMTGMNITGYPAGDISRVVVASAAQQTAAPYGMAQGRNKWTTSVNSILTQTSYCNVALQGTVDVNTRVLTVVAQVYYTANSPVSTNSLTIFLLEDKVIGPQHNYGTPYYNAANYNADGSYNHNHVLRKGLTPTYGITIPVTTMGTTFTTTATYTIPATYGAAGKTNPCLLGNLELAAFVTETDRPTITGANGPVMLSGFANALDIATTNMACDPFVCSGSNFASSFKFTNMGSTPVTSAVFSYSMNGTATGTINWSGNVNSMTSSQTVTVPLINFTALPSNTITVDVVSVNGSNDQNAVNNLGSKTTILTTAIANSINMQMDFTQDQYGSEDSWVVYNEVSNAIISQDGPFTDLAASGTLLHTKTFTIGANTCYKLVVSDAYGDGVNSGYGVGGYSLKSGGSPIITSNGQYGTGETKLYKSSASVGIGAVTAGNINAVNIYPNPTAGTTNLSVDLRQNESVSVSVLNAIGQEVYTLKSANYNAGVNTISFNTENWAAGVYFVNVATANGSVKQKLTVNK